MGIWVASMTGAWGQGTDAKVALEIGNRSLALVAGESMTIEGEVRNLAGTVVPLWDLAIFVRASAGTSTNLSVDFATPLLEAMGPDVTLPSAGYRGPLLVVHARPSSSPPPASSVRLELSAGSSVSNVVVVWDEVQINFPQLAVAAIDGAMLLSWAPPDPRFDVFGRSAVENRVPWRRLTNEVAGTAGRREMRVAPNAEARFFRLQMR